MIKLSPRGRPFLTCFFVYWAISISIFVPGNDLSGQDGSNELRRVQREFLDRVKPNLERNCGDCHWGAGADADLDFEQFETLDQLLVASRKWKKVVKRLNDGDMPPEDAEPISAEDKSELLQWMQQLFDSVDCTDVNPGRVTVRRLNRTEYANTVYDLIGVQYRPAESFPGDDVGYGFDNIADVLSLPPILMEKYLAAAEQIIDQAVDDPDNPLVQYSIASDRLTSKKGTRRDGIHLLFLTNAKASMPIDVPRKGRYEILVRAFGDQAGDEPAKMALALNGERVKEVNVRATEYSPKEFRFTSYFRKGANELELAFVNDFYERRKGDRNLYISNIEVNGPLHPAEVHRKLFFLKSDEVKKEPRKAAARILFRHGSRAYRRPLKKEEIERLLKLYDVAQEDGSSFEASVGFALQAVLVSPHFLFKVEQPAKPNKVRKLNTYELANSLSYFLWSTMPDDELFRLASSSALNDDSEYRKQIRRLLKSPRSSALVENFAAQWLQLRALVDFEPDPDLFPGVNVSIREYMATETKMLFKDVLRKNGSVLDLLSADYTFVNEKLARHYRFKGVDGKKFRKIKLPDSRRGGLLTQASILTLTSNPTRTSPVKRGKWILENLLGEEPSFPDPDVMPLEDQAELTGTLRERMEQHRSNPACAACHLTMDALGFSLEHYDAVGRWRDSDEGLAIDPSGELPDGTQFSGAQGLQQLVSSKMKDQFLRCFAEKLLIYALGRGLEYYDECAVDKILEQAKKDNYKIHSFIVAVCESEPFRKRRGPSQPVENSNE